MGPELQGPHREKAETEGRLAVQPRRGPSDLGVVHRGQGMQADSGGL